MWDNTPFEILLSVFGLIDNVGTLYQCSIVCKQWSAPAEYELYSQLIIVCMEQLIKFNTLFQSVPRLACLVETVEIECAIMQTEASQANLMYDFLCHLPNLQHFRSQYSPCYVDLISAFADLKLNKLKSISLPTFVEDWKEYTNCVILAKNHLEELFLTDSSKLFDSHNVSNFAYYDRLYQQLPGFKNLTKLIIEKTTVNPTRELESIIEHCSQTLQQLHFYFSQDEYYLQEYVGERAIMTYVPRPKIEFISATFSDELEGYELLSYMCYKFPGLKTLNLTLNLTNIQLDQIFMNLIYVRNLSIHGTYEEPEDICDTFQLLADYELLELLERVEINYSLLEYSRPLLDWGRKPNTNYDVLTLSYSVQDQILGHYSFIESVGSHIKVLDLSCMIRTENMKISRILTHILTFCPYLTKLTLRSYDIRKEDGRRCIEADKIKGLVIRDCNIHQRGLECLFFWIPYIHDLRFSNVTFFNYLGRASTFIYLGLPNTRIGNLSVDLNSSMRFISKKAPRYIFLNVYIELPEQYMKNCRLVDFYYKYDFVQMDDKRFKPITAKEYYDEYYNMYTHFGIGCRAIKRVNIYCNGTVVVLS